jgi:hypothetical protein
MHDPMTVICDIKSPFKKKGETFRDTIITLWHVDPETDGSDDSCDWFNRKHKGRPAWQHPRFHVWHYKLQIHPWQDFKRWAFSRCAVCGGRFKWAESVIGSWEGTKIWHMDCEWNNTKGASKT